MPMLQKVQRPLKNSFRRLFKNVRVQGAKKGQGRSVLPVREDLTFLKQRSNRMFFNSLPNGKTARWEMAWTNMVNVPGGKKTETVKPPSFLRLPTTSRAGPSRSLGGRAPAPAPETVDCGTDLPYALPSGRDALFHDPSFMARLL
ncbi:MAG: hypothetical protein KJ724_14980 [Proteobacteria bacterium]|nr:hypothetical protein [Pseudomonadota bacterium]